MYYLSDKLFYGIDPEARLSAKVGDQVNYDLSIRPSGVDPSTLTEYAFTKVYSGSITVFGGDQFIYLNDILSTHMYDHEYMRAPTTPISTVLITPQPTPSTIKVPPYFLIDVKITFPDHNYNPSPIKNILQCYLSPGEVGEDIDASSSIPKIYNILNQRTRIVPRIPRIQGETCNFWFSFLGVGTKGFWTNSDRYKVVAVGSRGETDQYKRIRPHGSTFVKEFGELDYLELTGNDYTINIDGTSLYEAKELWLSDLNFNVKVKLAEIEDCPSKYYLIWMDRSGAYQCQPFSKKSTRMEEVTKTKITNFLEEDRVVGVSIKDSWRLNTDWLSEEEYKAYDSIITSPYLYLYDTEVDRGYWVNCKNNKWEEKTVKNNKKLFNMSVEVESIAPTNITY